MNLSPSLLSTLLVTTVLLGACNQTLRPQHSSINDTLQQAQTQPLIVTPIAIPEPKRPNPGSLWLPGNKEFFKDSRASQVGDTITVLVEEAAEAETEAITEITRNHETNSDITNVGNLEGILRNRFITNPAGAAINNLLNTDSQRTFDGEGITEREDTLSARIAAVVTQVLPNGYLVIQGKREIVVNYELQELQIQGIVKPSDIRADNTIASDRIAEARIFYAGRGTVDEAQTPQYGVRFLDKYSPF